MNSKTLVIFVQNLEKKGYLVMDTIAEEPPIKMPGAFTILFILTVVVVVLTWFIPAGSYAKLSYDSSDHCLQVVSPSGHKELVPATQAELDKLNVKIKIKQFTFGAINKPVLIHIGVKNNIRRGLVILRQVWLMGQSMPLISPLISWSLSLF